MDVLSSVKSKMDNVMTLLAEIKIQATDILKKLDPVMKNIKDVKNDIVVQICKKHPEYEVSVLQDAMQSITVEWIKDASAIKLEIDKFVVELDEGFLFQTDSNICPFLTEVWNGDLYDIQGVDGLKELKKDLAKQFADINRENLFILTIQRIKENS